MEKTDEGSEGESSVEVKEEPADEMRDFAENTMNELLGWYGYDKVDETDTQGLQLNHFAKTMQETLSQALDSNTTSGETSSEKHPSKHKEKQNKEHKPIKHGQHSRDKPTPSPLRPIAPSVPTVTQQIPIVGVYAGNPTTPTLVQGNAVAVLRNSIEHRIQPPKDQFSVTEEQLPEKQIVCAWCQQFGMKRYTLNTSSESKAFCSEKCFAACRRAYFKRNKVCDWCKHVRHTKEYLDYGNKERRLQFCSIKCLNQYKMDIFCKETQAALPQSGPVGVVAAPTVTVPSSPIDVQKGVAIMNGNTQIITPESWSKSSEQDKHHVMVNSSSMVTPVGKMPSPRISVTGTPTKSQSELAQRTETVIQSGQIVPHPSTLEHPSQLPGSHPSQLPGSNPQRGPVPIFPEQQVVRSPMIPSQTGNPQQPQFIVTPPPGVTGPPHRPPQAHHSVPLPPHFIPPPPGTPRFPHHMFPPFPHMDPAAFNLPPPTVLVPYPVMIPFPVPIPIPIPVRNFPNMDTNSNKNGDDIENSNSNDCNTDSVILVEERSSDDAQDTDLESEPKIIELDGSDLEKGETKGDDEADETMTSPEKQNLESLETEEESNVIVMADSEEKRNNESSPEKEMDAATNVDDEKCLPVSDDIPVESKGHKESEEEKQKSETAEQDIVVEKTQSDDNDQEVQTVIVKEQKTVASVEVKSSELKRTEKEEECKRVNSEHAYAASPIEEPVKDSHHSKENNQTPTPTNNTHKVVSDHAYALRRSGRIVGDHSSSGGTLKRERAAKQTSEPPVKRRSLRSHTKLR
ncbi:uncharacterized protein LOC144433365 [Glandiceps talaboti]